jgi:hypothetical protein
MGPLLLLPIILAPADPAPPQDAARALVVRAVRAVGGEEKLRQRRASYTRLKGTLHYLGGVPFTGESFSQPGGAFKQTQELTLDGAPMYMTEVYSGASAWRTVNGQTQDIDNQTVAVMTKARHADRVLSLLPLLADGKFVLTALGEARVEGRPVDAVRVSHEGQPDVTLYFDRQAGFLVKSEYRALDEREGAMTLRAIVYADYREVDPAMGAEQVLQEAGRPTQTAALLDWLRKQAVSEAGRAEIQALIRRLGDESFPVRERASAALADRGAAAIPLLRQALKDPDPEVASRAGRCLQKLKQESPATLAAAVRLLALRRPAGAAAVLLAYLPSAPNEDVAREVRHALAQVAVRDGKPEPVLEQALAGMDPARRAAAAAALGRDGGAWEREPGRPLWLRGLKVPMKVTSYRDGRKTSEWQKVEVRYFNRFPESVFARP